jgi:hypothetical protein
LRDREWRLGMNGDYIDITATMSGIVIIAAGFAASLIYCTSKKMDSKVVISVPIVIAVLIGAGFYGFGGPTTVKEVAGKLLSSPKQTLEKYCEYYKNGDYGPLYDLFAIDSPLRKSNTRTQIVQYEQDTLGKVNGINTCTVNAVQENGDSATGFVTVINGLGEVADEKVFLKKEGYEWKIIAWSYASPVVFMEKNHNGL